MIAAFPMYAFPRTAAADAALWALIRDALGNRGVAAPDRLTLVPGDLRQHWLHPELVLSQTCGRPYKEGLHGKIQLVGTPDYGVKGCPPGHYRSLVIARAEDPRADLVDFAGARFALNGPDSQSGWAALAAERPEVLTGPHIRTGSHRSSVLAVRAGEADFAAIDAVTFRHLTAASEATGLRILHATQFHPGLPLVTSLSMDADLIFEAVEDAVAKLAKIHRETLGLRGIRRIEADQYLALPDPRAEARLTQGNRS